MRQFQARFDWVACLCLATAACTGAIESATEFAARGGSAGPESSPSTNGVGGTGPATGVYKVGSAPANCPSNTPQAGPPPPRRRLTSAEYNATVHDLLGDTTTPAASFPRDSLNGALFDNDSAALGVQALLTQYCNDAAKALAKAAVGNLSTLVPCDPAKCDATCASGFVKTFGNRGFRRPLTPEEVTRYT